jgi:hypothetical protein
MNLHIEFKNKYLKYKNKYKILKEKYINQTGGNYVYDSSFGQEQFSQPYGIVQLENGKIKPPIKPCSCLVISIL